MYKCIFFYKKCFLNKYFYLPILLFFPHILFASEFSIIAGINKPYFIEYSETRKHGSGIAIDIITSALSGENIPYSFDKYDWPWIRAMAAFNDKKNTIGFLTKTPDREKFYRWITPVFSDDLSVFTFERNKSIENLEELKKVKRIGALSGSGSENTLISKGLKEQIISCKTDKQCLELLSTGDLDAWVASEQKSNYWLKDMKLKNRVQKGMTILNTNFWIIASLKTDAIDYNKLKVAFEKFKKKKAYSNILKEYE